MAGRRSSIRQSAPVWFMSWAVFCLMWFLFVATLSWHELSLGMGAATLATLGFRLVKKKRQGGLQELVYRVCCGPNG